LAKTYQTGVSDPGRNIRRSSPRSMPGKAYAGLRAHEIRDTARNGGDCAPPMMIRDRRNVINLRRLEPLDGRRNGRRKPRVALGHGRPPYRATPKVRSGKRITNLRARSAA